MEPPEQLQLPTIIIHMGKAVAIDHGVFARYAVYTSDAEGRHRTYHYEGDSYVNAAFEFEIKARKLLLPKRG